MSLPTPDSGATMHGWARDLFPIPRSLTGPGVRETLAYLHRLLPGLTVQSIPSGTPVLDWIVPEEWTLRDAYVADEAGTRLIDTRAHTLHIVGYSLPVDEWMTCAELDAHLHSLPERPDAIPYVTAYYARTWGFCVTETQRAALRATPERRLRVVIDATRAPGVLNWGELVIPGESDRELLLSTYICHPSMANNELSGPVVTTAAARWLAALPRLPLTVRVVFVPETIGAIAVLSRHLAHLRARLAAGYVVTCIGDERATSYLPSRAGDTLADRAALHALSHVAPGFHRYSWLDRGSDERQYCAPHVDLPVASIMRSKYATYPEYHTSDDDLSLVTPAGLEGGLEALLAALRTILANGTPEVTVAGEPQLGRRGLYPTVSTRGSGLAVREMMNLISYADGSRDLIAIGELIGAPVWRLRETVDRLVEAGLIRFTQG